MERAQVGQVVECRHDQLFPAIFLPHYDSLQNTFCTLMKERDRISDGETRSRGSKGSGEGFHAEIEYADLLDLETGQKRRRRILQEAVHQLFQMGIFGKKAVLVEPIALTSSRAAYSG